MNLEYPSTLNAESEAPADRLPAVKMIGAAAVAPTVEIAKKWQYEESGLTATPLAGYYRNEEAGKRLVQPGPEDNLGIAIATASRMNTLYDSAVTANTKMEEELAEIDAIIAVRGKTAALEGVRRQVAAQFSSTSPSELIKDHKVQEAVAGELLEQEKQDMEERIAARISADARPWGMPNMHLPQATLDGLRSVHDNLLARDMIPQPDDIFKVAPPMKEFEGSRYNESDEKLLQQAGISPQHGIEFTRAELQQVGVFFLNRVGGGEQPIFGAPIPDPESEDGIFNVQDRSFLTKEEFEKVYRYQQENGYGLEGRDASDVQMDMLMFAVRPEGRKEGVEKSGGFGSRENKYSLMRSPFIDSGFTVQYGVEPYIRTPDGVFRMNTLTLHLANGHPDYPGVSEMANDDVQHDQRYMSVGEFVKNFYQPPPDNREVLTSMQNGLPTARERVWGAPPPEA